MNFYEPDILASAKLVAGEEAVVEGATRVAGVVPKLYVTPPDVETLSATVKWANDAGQTIVPVGGGTKMEWGSLPSRVDIALSMAKLSVDFEHHQGDLIATIDAGMPLATANALLAQYGQWLPVDPNHAKEATIGGIVATNDSGPRRHQYGTPRDLILGTSFVRPDGQLAKAGGRVVKNVAGYDLSKLLAGSFGSLGVIVNATFKLTPIPKSSRTVVIQCLDAMQVGECVGELMSTSLMPSALEVQGAPYRLLVRFESLEAVTEEQAIRTSALPTASRCEISVMRNDKEQQCWNDHALRPWRGSGSVLKVSFKPSYLTEVLQEIQTLCAAHEVTTDVVGRAAVGSLMVGIEGEFDNQAVVIRALRSAVKLRSGHAVFLRGPLAIRSKIDEWGDLGDGEMVMRAIKQNFDPTGMMSPGRWPFD